MNNKTIKNIKKFTNLGTNNEQTEKEYGKTIPFTVAQKYLRINFFKDASEEPL
jgi:hypothetical protein